MGAGAISLLTLGIFACSTSVIFIKASTLHPVVLSTLRLMVAAVALFGFFVRDWVRHRRDYGLRELRRTLLPAALLALHFISWIVGARLTAAVNSSLIVNLVPLVTPWLLLWLVGERLTASEWWGTLVAVAGLVLLTGRDAQLGGSGLLGDGITLGSMVLFAGYLVLGRRNRDFPALSLYLCPLYAFSALMCGGAALASVDLAEQPWNAGELLLAVGLGLVPGVVGHTILNHAMTRMRGQVVSVANLGQFVFAGVLAYALLDEVPDLAFYPAALAVALGAAIALRPASASS